MRQKNIIILLMNILIYLNFFAQEKLQVICNKNDTVYIYNGGSYQGKTNNNINWYGNSNEIIKYYINGQSKSYPNVKHLYIFLSEEKNKLDFSKFQKLEELSIHYYPFKVDSNDLKVLANIKKLNFIGHQLNYFKEFGWGTELHVNNFHLFSISLYNYIPILKNLEKVQFIDLTLAGLFLNNTDFCNLPKLKSILFSAKEDFFPIPVFLRQNIDSAQNYFEIDFNHGGRYPLCSCPAFFSFVEQTQLGAKFYKLKNHFVSYENWKNKFPENGPFTTYNIYKKDTINVLCRGNFKNTLPDGKWFFYNCYGEVLEEREYKEGIPIGTWKQFHHSRIMVFEKGKLIKFNEIDLNQK
jgi:hypothetical protein